MPMFRKLSALGLIAATMIGAAPPEAGRPPITGISHLAVYATDMAATDHFYRVVLGARKGPDPEDPVGVR